MTAAAPLRARRIEEKATMMMECSGLLGGVSVEGDVRSLCTPNRKD